MGKTTAVVVALTPTSRGLGYVVLDTPGTPLDWGVKCPYISKRRSYTAALKALVAMYKPDMIVLPDVSCSPSRKKAVSLLEQLAEQANKESVPVVRYTTHDVKNVFSQFGSTTKFGVARTISHWLPDFHPHPPRYRHPWMSEQPSMAIFDALALALTYYYLND